MPIDITDVERRVQYAGSGTGPYNFTFQILDDDDIAVYQDDTLLTKTTHYTVTINPNGTGSITTTSSIPGSDNITIIGARPYARLTDFSTGGDFFAENVNDELDSILILIQQLREEIGRALQISSTSTFSGSATFPAPGAGEYLRWNVAGTALETVSASPDEGVFQQSGTGAVERSWTAKVGETVSAKDFGAVADGVTDDTAALKRAFDYALPIGATVVLEGDYLVSGAITTIQTLAAADLNIHCKGDVTITVSASATAFDRLIHCYSNAVNNSAITGGSLNIDLNNKCGDGIYIRHDNASSGGSVSFTARVKVVNARQNNNAYVSENAGIQVIGAYESVYMRQPYVKAVTRTNNSGGACGGITVSGFTGHVLLDNPYAGNVTHSAGHLQDADGIKVFGKNSGDGYKSQGRAVLIAPVFEDNQGRQLKSQCSDTTLIRPRSIRQMVVTITNGIDYDFQWGNGLLIEPDYEYRLNGATSPLGTSFLPVAFQQLLTDSDMSAKSVGGTLRTEVQMRNYAFVYHYNAALPALAQYSETIVEGLTIVPIGSLASGAFTRAIVETDMNRIVDKSEGTRIVVSKVSGPIGAALGIGYVGYTSGSLAAKLDIEVTDLNNTLTQATLNRPFDRLSGNTAVDPRSFLIRGNYNYRDLMPAGWTFNFNALRPGCVFNVDTATTVATNAPPWPSGTNYALIECLGDYFASTDKNVRVTIGPADRNDFIFYTRDGGTNWSVPSTLPSLTAAQIADRTNAINTTNKRIGKMVRDSTNNRIMIAAGTADNSAWWIADGSGSVTPV